MLSVTSARVQPIAMPRTERAVRRRFRPTLRNAYFDETQAMSIPESPRGLETRRSKRGPEGRDERGQENGQHRAPHDRGSERRVEAHRPGEAGERDFGRTSSCESGEVETGLMGGRHEHNP